MDRSRAAGRVVIGPPWLDLELTPFSPPHELVRLCARKHRSQILCLPLSRRSTRSWGDAAPIQHHAANIGRDAPGGALALGALPERAMMHHAPVGDYASNHSMGADASSERMHGVSNAGRVVQISSTRRHETATSPSRAMRATRIGTLRHVVLGNRPIPTN
jgi:hypothetical protein